MLRSLVGSEMCIRDSAGCVIRRWRFSSLLRATRKRTAIDRFRVALMFGRASLCTRALRSLHQNATLGAMTSHCNKTRAATQISKVLVAVIRSDQQRACSEWRVSASLARQHKETERIVTFAMDYQRGRAIRAVAERNRVVSKMWCDHWKGAGFQIWRMVGRALRTTTAAQASLDQSLVAANQRNSIRLCRCIFAELLDRKVADAFKAIRERFDGVKRARLQCLSCFRRLLLDNQGRAKLVVFTTWKQVVCAAQQMSQSRRQSAVARLMSLWMNQQKREMLRALKSLEAHWIEGSAVQRVTELSSHTMSAALRAGMIVRITRVLNRVGDLAVMRAFANMRSRWSVGLTKARLIKQGSIRLARNSLETQRAGVLGKLNRLLRHWDRNSKQRALRRLSR
eukprot:TRINITY_DN56309_c0_g1_i2.p1 TRINITY_DN56309_c0_g1~~TRINITY_DN56309_c0_g1_i2.p1  ORF type:complete len:397 (+),score=51.13 TRINITY_DN56309_c0_g1_i2:139-1329(+)